MNTSSGIELDARAEAAVSAREACAARALGALVENVWRRNVLVILDGIEAVCEISPLSPAIVDAIDADPCGDATTVSAAAAAAAKQVSAGETQGARVATRRLMDALLLRARAPTLLVIARPTACGCGGCAGRCVRSEPVALVESKECTVCRTSGEETVTGREWLLSEHCPAELRSTTRVGTGAAAEAADEAKALSTSLPLVFADKLPAAAVAGDVHSNDSSESALSCGCPMPVRFVASSLLPYSANNARLVLAPLAPIEAARLLVRSAPRRLRFAEMQSSNMSSSMHADSVLRAFSRHPLLSSSVGHPGLLTHVAAPLLRTRSAAAAARALQMLLRRAAARTAARGQRLRRVLALLQLEQEHNMLKCE